MTCDGSPGNPGVETTPGDDGPEKLACLGCSVCKPWNYEPFRSGVDIPPSMQGRSDVEEAVRGMAWAQQNPEAFKNAEGWVPCRSTRYGPGCGHNTLDHTGPSSPNQSCDCCTWRNGPDGGDGKLARISRKRRDTLDVQAALYASGTIVGGVTPAPDVESVVDDLSGLHASTMDALLGAMPNRAQRRAAKHGKNPNTGGNLPPRRRHR